MIPRVLRIKISLALVTAFFSLATTHSIASLDLAQAPLFLTQPVRPIVMLNMSNDHQLFFKAYDDYSDLTGNGVPNTTYTHGHSYYGYFDSQKCYRYSTTNGRFNPSRSVDADGYCNYSGVTNEWSGNFLNWSTMTRMDAVRKILYGGFRFIDQTSLTVLERAFLPQDAHAFAKYYSGNDLPRLTPYAHNNGATDVRQRGITICNATDPATRNQFSQNVTDPPKMMVARGNYSLWASNERWQCRWGNYANDNNPTYSGIQAYNRSPDASTSGTHGHFLGEFNVRVRVCVTGMLEENCRAYPEGSLKPSGLLQQYGEKGEILFGLMTGSYAKNKSGGVLRKRIGDLSNEINVDTDGTFKTAPTTGAIIGTLNLLRIYGYNFNDGTYNSTASGGDNCPWALSSFNDGRCSNWGNPQAEIYLESLRYLAGLSATSDYDANDSGYISGLTKATWADPINTANYCAPLNIIQFNASTTSFDADVATGAATLGITSVNTWTDRVGQREGIHGGSFFVGSNGTDNNQLCTPKTVNSLSPLRGACPDPPRLVG
jgi:type IV pilus assembly protein PilY1